MSTLDPDNGSYALARVVVAVRTAVVVSVGVLLLVGPDWVRQYTGYTIGLLTLAMVYAAVMLTNPHLEVRRTRYAWLVSTLDAVLTLALIVLTGGVQSPVATVLVLAVIASAARLSTVGALLNAALVAGGYFAVAMTTGTEVAGMPGRALQGAWWALYLLFVAVLVGGLSMLAESEQRSRIRALVEAEAEHAAAEEERDLRARLLRAYESQQDGLQVLLHEFRTPVASLQALAQALMDTATPMSAADRDTGLQLAAQHVNHLGDMMDALGDVALSRRPTFSSGRLRRVDIDDLVRTAADAVGLREPRLRVTGDVGVVLVDAQGLRRVLTNLLENASRHGRGEPIDVTCALADHQLTVAVLDRGPGVPPESLGELTVKYVSAGDQRGTTGLGLWIVQQILEAMGGRLNFSSREGGGLAATFSVPVD